MKVKKNFKIEEQKLVGFMVIITQHVAQSKRPESPNISKTTLNKRLRTPQKLSYFSSQF